MSLSVTPCCCVLWDLSAPCALQEELGSPALAFVRLLVQLLSLDSAVEDEVRLLRRSLLRLVGVDEFSPAANWVDPCISFRLHDVICRCVCVLGGWEEAQRSARKPGRSPAGAPGALDWHACALALAGDKQQGVAVETATYLGPLLWSR